MKPAVIEIYGTGTINRGAELMAISIAERLYQRFPDAKLVVGQGFGPYAARARYRLWATVEQMGVRALPLVAALRCCPSRVFNQLGLVHPHDIDVVLDASGFAFSDQWGPERAQTLLKRMTSQPRVGKPLVLMPQAFGPFQNRDVAEATKRLVDRADLVFARDATSLELLTELCGPTDKITESPDFTTTIAGVPDDTLQLPERFAAVVPNYHMIGKTDNPASYHAFLVTAVDKLRQFGLEPLLVMHDGLADKRVAETLASQGIGLRTIEHPDPRVLKWVLGQSRLAVASRFHSLVSALSQGIPCIGAGWSHKYRELFNGFDCPDLMIRDLDRPQEVEQIFDLVATPSAREAYRGRIQSAAQTMKDKTVSMWEQVEALIAAL